MKLGLTILFAVRHIHNEVLVFENASTIACTRMIVKAKSRVPTRGVEVYSVTNILPCLAAILNLPCVDIDLSIYRVIYFFGPGYTSVCCGQVDNAALSPILFCGARFSGPREFL